ncbi:hypothetical protein DFJ43DRAFT_1071648 [Lentinula guzmanii]|uniref:Uncharacterized protein n=1 Tax=Lentinula guzmanii TaxID=2804957 RepID=A0AA38N1F4_9AGAR|nr:hypothetical protein DFJ43DRAFT_1071648 [Lentinula guzmanii]
MTEHNIVERSRSRGRDMTSSGRGGLGNIHHAVDPTIHESGPDDYSVTRGREPAVNPDKVVSTGRGGAGNIRSPSRDIGSHPHAPVYPDPRQEELIRAEANREGVHSTGRGGLGNMSRSRSRDPQTVRAHDQSHDRSRSGDPEHHKHTGVSELIHKVLHPHHNEENTHHDSHTNPESTPKQSVDSTDVAPPLTFSRSDAK